MNQIYAVELNPNIKPLTVINSADESYFTCLNEKEDTYALYHCLQDGQQIIYKSDNLLNVVHDLCTDGTVIGEDIFEDGIFVFYKLESSNLIKIHECILSDSESVSRVILVDKYLFYSVQDDELDSVVWKLYDIEEDSLYTSENLNIFSSVFEPKVTLIGSKLHMILLESYVMPYEIEEVRNTLGQDDPIGKSRLVGVDVDHFIEAVKQNMDVVNYDILYQSNGIEYITEFNVSKSIVCFSATSGNRCRVFRLDLLDHSQSSFSIPKNELLGFVSNSECTYIVCVKNNIVTCVCSDTGKRLYDLEAAEDITNIKSPDIIDMIETALVFAYTYENSIATVTTVDIKTGESKNSTLNSRLFTWNGNLYKS